MSTRIDQDTYAVLRDRLTAQATELTRRAAALNKARTAEFGSGELALTGTHRIRTDHNCLPRDIVAVADDVLLFGRHTSSVGRAETSVLDVFALYDSDLNALPESAVPGLLDNPDFIREFTALHRYFRGAHLLRLRRVEDRLLAVFQTGEQADDLRVLRWSIGPSGETMFLDAQGERDHVFPPSHDVDWVETTRDNHVLGRHPHISLDDRIFVSTAGGGQCTGDGLAEQGEFGHRRSTAPSPEVYRSEHLAARLLAEHGADSLAGADLGALARRAAEAAYDEGYERGVHDHDAAAILETVLGLHESAGLLRYPAAARAAAQAFWAHSTTADARDQWTHRAISLTQARDLFGTASAVDGLRRELAEEIGDATAAAYLVDELASGPPGFAVSDAARTLLDKFRRTIGTAAYDDALAALTKPDARRQLVEAWLTAYASASGEQPDDGVLAEAVAVELSPELERYELGAPTTATVTGLLGTHRRVEGRALRLQLDEFLSRTRAFADHDVPAFRAYQQHRAELVTAERTRLRVAEYRPRVMSSFVRNRLVDDVYLPLIGDNLAKQIGAQGDAKRTDSHSLLLLLSPPGYGKTTLIEYVADRLGLLLVKVDGPALGQNTTSLDPALKHPMPPPAGNWRRSPSPCRRATTSCCTSTTSSTRRRSSCRSSSPCATPPGP